MIATFIANNVRTQTRKDGSTVQRAVLSDPEGTVEKFFHIDCRNGEHSILESLRGKKTKIEIYSFDTNYSDTISIQGKIITKES